MADVTSTANQSAPLGFATLKFILPVLLAGLAWWGKNAYNKHTRNVALRRILETAITSVNESVESNNEPQSIFLLPLEKIIPLAMEGINDDLISAYCEYTAAVSTLMYAYKRNSALSSSEKKSCKKHLANATRFCAHTKDSYVYTVWDKLKRSFT